MYSLIVVDYNSIEKTINYLLDFCSNCTLIPHMIIVDNSPIAQYDYVRTRLIVICESSFEVDGVKAVHYKTDIGEVVYCWHGDNLGYARGNNLGARISEKLFCDDYFLISNNDIRLIEKFDITVFEDIFNQNASLAVIGPRVIGIDGKEQSPHKSISAFQRLILYYWINRWPFRAKLDYDYSNVSKICYRVMGSFMLIKARFFYDIDGFDPETFMFAEEMILSERLKKRGYNVYFYNDYTVVHEHGVSVKNNASLKRSEQWGFDSCCYYYVKYKNASSILIRIANINFKLYLVRISLREVIKKILIRLIFRKNTRN